jgi:hypothetical protein
VTRTYSNTAGLRLAYNFDAGNGKPRREPVTIVLTERNVLSNQVRSSYIIHTGADVEALWDVIVNPLRVTFWQPCDLLSDADPLVSWLDATGVAHEAEFDPDLGDTVTIGQGFSGIWHEAKASDELFQPSIVWSELDGPNTFVPPPPGNFDDPLLPTEDQDNSLILVEHGGDCSAVFDYSVRVNLRTYPGLPST